MTDRIPWGAEPPAFDDPDLERAERQRQLVLAYRIFGALRWGDLGDGHITARDPERTDHFWLLRFGVAFRRATRDDLVLVAPDGSVAAGDGVINVTAYNIHHPIHAARPDVVAAAHTHTPYGTPWSATGRLFRPITQEACEFYGDHALFDDEEVAVATVDGGKRIAAALGECSSVILRNHGLLTAGTSVADACARFVSMERVAEVHVKAPDARPLSPEGAARAHGLLTRPTAGWHIFNFLVATHLDDDDLAAA